MRGKIIGLLFNKATIGNFFVGMISVITFTTVIKNMPTEHKKDDAMGLGTGMIAAMAMNINKNLAKGGILSGVSSVLGIITGELLMNIKIITKSDGAIEEASKVEYRDDAIEDVSRPEGYDIPDWQARDNENQGPRFENYHDDEELHVIGNVENHSTTDSL